MKKLFRRSRDGRDDASGDAQGEGAGAAAYQGQQPYYSPSAPPNSQQQPRASSQYSKVPFAHRPSPQPYQQSGTSGFVSPATSYSSQHVQHGSSPPQASWNSPYGLTQQPVQQTNVAYHERQGSLTQASQQTSFPYGSRQPSLSNAGTTVEQGDYQVAANDFEGAIETYTNAVRQNPTDGDILIKRAYAYRMLRPPRLQEALADAQTACRSNPYDWKNWSQLGQVCLDNRNVEFALEALEKAVEIGGDQVNSVTNGALRHARQVVEKGQMSSQPSVQTSSRASGQISGQTSSQALPNQAPSTAEPSIQTVQAPPTRAVPSSLRESPSSSTAASYWQPQVVSYHSTAQAPVPHETSPPPPVPTPPAAQYPPYIPPSPASPPTPGSTNSHPPAPSSSRTPPPPSATLFPSMPTPPPTTSGPIQSPPPPTTSAPVKSSPPTSPSVQSAPPTSVPLRSPPPTSAPRQSLPQTSTADQSPPQTSPIRSSPQTSPPAVSISPPTENSTSGLQSPTSESSVPLAESSSLSPAPAQSSSQGPVSTKRAAPTHQTPPEAPVAQAPPRSPNPAARTLDNEDFQVEPLSPDTTPTVAPPSYVPNMTSSNRAVRELSQQALREQLVEFETGLLTQLRGSVRCKAFKSADKYDNVQLMYFGLSELDLTNRERGIPTFAHPTFKNIAVPSTLFPGTTYYDMDPETLLTYEGTSPGTMSVSGYSEEYRRQQDNLHGGRISLALVESQHPSLPTLSVDFLIKRIHSLQSLRNPPSTDASLREILGPSLHLTGTNDRQSQIKALCYKLNVRDNQTFANYVSGRNVSTHVFGSTAAGSIGLKNWLHHLVLGAELLRRMRQETRVVSYVGLMTDDISALLGVVDQFMSDVDVTIQPAGVTPRYKVLAREHSRQTEGLIRFAELLRWPYMDELRAYAETAFSKIVNGQMPRMDVYDWYYALVRPGVFFRYQIMACLIYASDTTRDMGQPTTFASGVVLADKSYWPRTTVLGKVLGGCHGVNSVCGWVGPCVRPSKGKFPRGRTQDGTIVFGDAGFVELSARQLTCPVPCSVQDDELALQLPEEDEATFIAHLTNVAHWVHTTGPTASDGAPTRTPVTLKDMELVDVVTSGGATTAPTPAQPLPPRHRATLVFAVGSGAAQRQVKYTLFSNPFFVSAHPCVGQNHLLYEREVSWRAKHTLRAADLKDAYPPPDELVIIDALSAGGGDGGGDEECMARAWCAERGFNALVRRGPGCCYACAVIMAKKAMGLAFNVLIWS